MPATLSAYALTTLNNVKEYLDLSTAVAKDNLLIRLINTASAAIERGCNRKFLSREYTDEVHFLDNYTRRLMVDNFPITAIDSITDDDVALTADELADCQNRTSFIYLDTERAGEIKVTYTAGYATIPDDLEQACIMLVDYYYKKDIANFGTMFMESGTAFRPWRLPPHVEFLLAGYRKHPV